MPSFFEIGPPVPVKKIFEGFCTIYGHGGHLGHVNLIIYIHIVYPIAYIKFGFDWPSGFRGDV